ncbi:MAG: sensor domain-containing diguanylate cyclase [Oscillospiraceae bacterium]|nr:sensor domain-containing diguanylate cyclase [Oscillospiraceae bacterium]
MQEAKRSNKFPAISVVSLMISITLCSFLISMAVINRSNLERAQIEQFISEQVNHINERIYKLFHKTDSLAAVIVHNNGNLDNFEYVAMSLSDDSVIMNILVAPGGVVSQVYPITGNEAVIGLDFFSEGAGNKEAIAARESGELVLGGPFNLVQGGQALVGRKPIFIDGEFWGLVSVTLKYPQIISDIAELEWFAARGLSYELWRISPDTNERQIIAGTITDYTEDYLEKRVDILNAEWYLRVAPFRAWYAYSENIILILSGIFICVLVFLVMQNNYILKNMRTKFENMAKTDALTNIHNRRFFMEQAIINTERSSRLGTTNYIILFDLDNFKNVNDTYGHSTGDLVLSQTALRIKTLIRPYDLFARYGGEEFIILAENIDENNVSEMAERMRISICGKTFESGESSVSCSASFGIAAIEKSDLTNAIKCADDALYIAKNQGKNRINIYNKQEELL